MADITDITERSRAIKPRSRSTGDRRTETTLSIDYLSVTFPNTAGVLSEVLRLFGGESPWEEAAGNHGYSRGLRHGAVAAFYGGNGNTIWIELRGNGCRQLEIERGLSSEEAWMAFLSRCLEWGARVNRIDFALDERVGLIHMGTVFRKIAQGCVVARFENAWDARKRRLTNGQKVGEMATFGGAHSAYKVRIYDKAAERRGKGIDCEDHWTRVEVESREGNAATLVRAFVSSGSLSVRQDLAARLSFRVRNANDTNRSRWKECAWWSRFLSATPVLVPRSDAPSDADPMGKVLRQYSRLLASLQREEGAAGVSRLIAEATAIDAARRGQKMMPEPMPSGVLRGVRAMRQLRAKLLLGGR